MFPAGLMLIHCLDKASLPCKGCVATAESNGLLEKEHLLAILIKNPSPDYVNYFGKKVTFTRSTHNFTEMARDTFCLLLYEVLNVYRTVTKCGSSAKQLYSRTLYFQCENSNETF